MSFIWPFNRNQWIAVAVAAEMLVLMVWVGVEHRKLNFEACYKRQAQEQGMIRRNIFNSRWCETEIANGRDFVHGR